VLTLLSDIYGATRAASHELPGMLSNSPATHTGFQAVAEKS